LALFCAWSARPAGAQAGRKAGAKKAPSHQLPALATWELSNGLRVAHLRVRRAPTVSVQLWYHVGSKDDPRDRRGLARMFEHLMFGGSEHLRPNAHRVYLEGVGGTANAAVTEDASGYMNSAPREYLDYMMRLEAERMRNLVFREDLVEAERKDLQNAIQRLSRDPLKMGVWRFLETAYKVHPYATEASGVIEDIGKITAEDAKKFYDQYYQPNNALLVVVGDADEESVRESAKRWFSPIPRAEPPPRPADDLREPEQNGARRRKVEAGQVGLVIAGYHIPEAKHPDIYALQLLSLVLGVGPSSRLQQRLVRTDGVARDAGCSAIVREHPGLFVLFGAYDTDAQQDKVEAALLDEVAALKKRAPKPEELRRAKNAIVSGFFFGLEQSESFGHQVGISWILTGDPGQFLHDIEAFESLTAADLQRVAGKYLEEKNLTVVVVPPAAGGQR